MREKPKTGRIELHTWRDFTKVMKVMGAGAWIYRGHEDSGWRLSSTLDRHMDDSLKVHKEWNRETFRLNLPRAEFFAISKFREMAKRFQEFDSDAAALIAMQHYGAKTRLLDFTMSIMVALFFAYEKRATGKSRAIYAINYGALMNQGGVWLGYQSFLKRIAAEEQAKRKIDRDSERAWWNLESQFENHYFQRYVTEEAAANIWSCTPQGAKGIIPLYKPLYNGRQAAQAGIELMPRTFDGFNENLAEALRTTVAEIEEPATLITSDVSHAADFESVLPSALVKLVLDPKMEDDAWLMLDQANISAATIYPDMVGLAKSVRYSEKIVLGVAAAKRVVTNAWTRLEQTVRTAFPTYGGQDAVKVLKALKVEGIEVNRLSALKTMIGDGADTSVTVGEADVGFIEDVIAQIQQLETITDVVIPREKVFACSLDSAIHSIVEMMVKNSFSHVPVLDESQKVVGVFSESTLLESKDIDRRQGTMRDVAGFLPLEKHTADVFRFVPKGDTVLHLRKLCDDALKASERIGMFFVTESGSPDEPLLGIFTVWDVACAPDRRQAV